MSTLKQRTAAKILVESGGSIPIGEAMVQAGYSPETAKTPQKLTESDGFKEFVHLLPDDKKIALTLHRGLEATKRDHFTGEMEIDFSERRQTAKLITELKGYHRQEFNINQQFNADSMKVEFGGGE